MSMKMPSRLRLGARAAFAATLATAVVACGSDGDSSTTTTAGGGGGRAGATTIRVAVTPVATAGCLIVTDERGLFRRAGLTLDFAPAPATSAAQIAQILNGQFTAGFGGINGVISAVANNLDVVMTNSLDRDFVADGQSSVAVIAGRDRGIESFRDLEGKTVGVNSLQGTWEVMLKEAIEKDGGDPSKVRLVPISFGDHATALGSGRIDAVTTAQPLVALLTDQGFESIGDPQAIMMDKDDTIAGGVFMARDWVEENADAVRAFVDTLQEGNEWCNDPANAREMRRAIARITELPQRIVDQTPLPNFDATLTAAETQAWIDGMEKHGMLPNAPSVEDVQWSGALEQTQ